MLDLSKYSPKLSDGAVVSWTSYTTANRRAKEREMTFTVKAQVLKVGSEDTAEDEKEETVEKDEL